VLLERHSFSLEPPIGTAELASIVETIDLFLSMPAMSAALTVLVAACLKGQA
jgi:hypothetical protein